MIKAAVAELLTQLSSLEISPQLLETPQDRRLGDVALPCFSFAKELKKSPVQIAQDIAGELQANEKIASIVATGPYINFFMNPAWIAAQVLTDITVKGFTYGHAPKNGQKILLEGWQPNTHKIFHVGHLRNALVSEAIATICEAGGYEVTRCSYLGDIGAHVAKWMWYYTNFDNSPMPAERVSIRAGAIYVAAGQKIDEDLDVYKAQVHDIQHQLESGDEKLVKIWKETAQKCLDDIHVINEELGSTNIEREYLESEVEQPGIELVKKYVAEAKGGIKYSEGAIILDLEEHDLGVFVLLKSNGTSLYSTKDLALAHMKKEEFTFDKSLYIVATEQIHHFNQLFKMLELTGYEGADKLEHISYGMVELASGKMSSRDGNIITYYDLRDRMVEQATLLASERNGTEEEKKSIAQATAFGAMKFDMLLQDAFKRIVFDMEKALSFEGETGPYIQYTYARCSSILRKDIFTDVGADLNFSLLDKPEERMLLVLLQEFSTIVLKAAEEYKPNLVARYILDLSRMFNSYYQKVHIIDDDIAATHARGALVAGVRQVLKNGLHLLGIKSPEKM